MPCGTQEGHGFFGLRTKFAGQVEIRPAWRQSQPYDKSEIPGVAGFFQDLRELGGVVEYEIADAVRGVCLRNGRSRFNRMHEVNGGVRKDAAHETDFADRGAVEMAQAALIKGAQHDGIRIAFDCIEGVTWEGIDETGRCGA